MLHGVLYQVYPPRVSEVHQTRHVVLIVLKLPLFEVLSLSVYSEVILAT